jgi:lysophospholipase L1-like esterase
MNHTITSFGLALLTCVSTTFARETPVAALPMGARLAIVGDSITEQKLYSKFIETYLIASAGRQDVHCFQFGWSGEQASGFASRVENDLAVFKPTAATLCYGMNDGHYVPYADAIGAEYEKNMRSVLTKLQAMGVKTIVTGAPGAVDTKYFTRIEPAVYNDNLAHLRDLDRKLSVEFHTAFGNVHDEMTTAMTKAKAALGADYDVCGRDGVHPGPNGHLLMAAALLKGLGCDGDIGTLTVDMNGAAQASDGHKVTNSAAGQADFESTRWPFCFDGDSKSGTRSILPFCDFNQALNRLILQVNNLTTAKARVTWGGETLEFSKDQLAIGINLAAEFSKTPFDADFNKFMAAVGTKQNYETPMIKGMITNFRNFAADIQTDPEFAAALQSLKTKLAAKQAALDTAARQLLVPVKHRITVQPVQ